MSFVVKLIYCHGHGRSSLPSPPTVVFAWCFVAGRRNEKTFARAEVRQKRTSNWNARIYSLSIARKTRPAVRGTTRKWTKSEAGLSIESPRGEHLGRSSMYQRLTYEPAIGDISKIPEISVLLIFVFAYGQHCL